MTKMVSIPKNHNKIRRGVVELPQNSPLVRFSSP